MELFQLGPQYWFCAILVFVLMQLTPTLPRTTYFGILNLGVLFIVFDWKVAALMLALSGLLAVSLQAVGPSNSGAAKIISLSTVVIAAIIALIIGQKLLVEFVRELPAQGLSSFDANLRRLSHVLQLAAFAYVGLRAWDATYSVRQGRPVLGPIAMSGFLAPFFMMPAGPVNVYARHIEMDSVPPPTPSLTWYVDGIELIVRGLFIKIVISELLRLLVVGLSDQWPTQTVLDTAIIFVFVYLDFWGYSLIALGIGLLLGVPTPVNFNAPFRSLSLTEFWTRWHASLGDMVRRVIFTPMQLVLLRRSKGRHPYLINALSLGVAFAFIGVWHRPTPAFLCWGLLVAALLAIEKPIRDKLVAPQLRKRPSLIGIAVVLGPIYVLSAIILSLHYSAIHQVVGGRP